MNILIIGGTGIISSAVMELLAAQNHSLYMLNRGLHSRSFHKAVIPLVCDINDEKILPFSCLPKSEETMNIFKTASGNLFSSVLPVYIAVPFPAIRSRKVHRYIILIGITHKTNSPAKKNCKHFTEPAIFQ